MALIPNLQMNSQENPERDDSANLETFQCMPKEMTRSLLAVKKYLTLNLAPRGDSVDATSHSDASARSFDASETKSVQSTPVRPHMTRRQKFNFLKASFKSNLISMYERLIH